MDNSSCNRGKNSIDKSLSSSSGDSESNSLVSIENFPRRSGKWSDEELIYAEQLIAEFEDGTLNDCEDGTTLRAYLAKKLNCSPMRISKKFAGKCIGKYVFSKNLSLNKLRRIEQMLMETRPEPSTAGAFHQLNSNVQHRPRTELTPEPPPSHMMQPMTQYPPVSPPEYFVMHHVDASRVAYPGVMGNYGSNYSVPSAVPVVYSNVHSSSIATGGYLAPAPSQQMFSGYSCDPPRPCPPPHPLETPENIPLLYNVVDISDGSDGSDRMEEEEEQQQPCQLETTETDSTSLKDNTLTDSSGFTTTPTSSSLPSSAKHPALEKKRINDPSPNEPMSSEEEVAVWRDVFRFYKLE